MFLSSKKLEGTNTKGGDSSFECLLPLEVFWELEKLLKQIEYLMASNEDPVQISELTHKIVKRLVTYIVFEKEKAVLLEKLHGPSSS